MNFQNTAHVLLLNAHCATSIKALHLYAEENLEKYGKDGMGWTIQGLNPRSSKRFFSSAKHPNRLWVSPSLLFNRYQDSFPGIMWS
jgi:hypothetical protein